MEPDCRAHCITGWDTPSSWTKTTPSTSGSATSWTGSRSRVAAKDSSVPALISQVSSVPNAAAIQDASDRGPERVELDAGHEGQGQLHHDRLPEQRREGDRDPADRGRQLDEQRTHDQADQPGGGRRPRAAAPTRWP